MGFIEGLDTAPGGRADVEALVREIVANPAAVPRRQMITVAVTGAPVAAPLEEGGDG